MENLFRKSALSSKLLWTRYLKWSHLNPRASAPLRSFANTSAPRTANRPSNTYKQVLRLCLKTTHNLVYWVGLKCARGYPGIPHIPGIPAILIMSKHAESKVVKQYQGFECL